ncbi:hypothetical protein U1Q18_003220 [Sarracenia purpurea var. burkii]
MQRVASNGTAMESSTDLDNFLSKNRDVVFDKLVGVPGLARSAHLDNLLSKNCDVVFNKLVGVPGLARSTRLVIKINQLRGVIVGMKYDSTVISLFNERRIFKTSVG